MAQRQQRSPQHTGNGKHSHDPQRTWFPFFALPRELRDMIYSMVFEFKTPSSLGSPTRFSFDLPDFPLIAYEAQDQYLQQSQPYSVYSGLPPWTHVNKQLFEEAIDVLATGNVFEVSKADATAYPDVRTVEPSVMEALGPVVRRTRSATRGQTYAYHHRILFQSIRTIDQRLSSTECRPLSAVLSWAS
ncbi:hypothetical protein CC86DRAFT_18287 [Ophiobolus disseminans]|uniref:Uncharacterized protein n=1 Tax=Ophiobolus disseminans TaxID=1469910 RepID=A0A6A7AL85_9PLEO|nr:hypothetical protein CC86DRAFT_18287 [Ophiobolus disseminans]